jgi:hypothetical protein
VTDPTTAGVELVPASHDPAQQLAVVCGECRRPRTLADDYDYTPLQLFTGRKLGWYNGDDGQMCGECLGLMMKGQLP